jgi:hypothetical protein
MQTVRVDFPFGAFRQFNAGEDVRHFCLKISIHALVAFGIRSLQSVKVHPLAEYMAFGGYEYYARDILPRPTRKELGTEQLGEKEWPYMICCRLILDIIRSELEWPNNGGRVMD